MASGHMLFGEGHLWNALNLVPQRMGVVLQALIKEGPLGIHFLKGGILPKREPTLWSFWGSGTLNNYQMTEGMFAWVESRRNNLAEGKPGGNVAHSLGKPQTGRRRIQAKVHTIDPMCEAVRLLDGPAPRWSQQRKPGIQRLQDSQMHEEDDCNPEP